MNESHIPYDVLTSTFQRFAAIPWTPAGEEERQKKLHVPMPFPWVDLSSVIAISHVSKRWREAALATPACWSTVTIKFTNANKDRAEKEKVRLEFLLSRAQTFPFDVIILDEGMNETWPSHAEVLTDIMLSTIKQARGVYARVMDTRLASLIAENLADVPMLECLALWWDGSEVLQIDSFTDDYSQLCMPKAYLRHAPRLRSIQARGFPYPDLRDGPISLLSLETFISEDNVFLHQTIQDYDLLLHSCERATSFTLLPDYHLRNISRGPIITLSHLVYLGLSVTSMVGLFYPSPRFIAPSLGTIAIHSKGEVYFTQTMLEPIAREFEKSTAPRKRFILIMPGDDSRGFPGQSSLPCSLKACIQVLNLFKFVQDVEFKHNVWNFKPSWNRTWITGADPAWAMQTGAIVPLYQQNAPEENNESPCIDGGGPGGANILGNGPHSHPDLGRDEISLFLDSQKESFMPNIRTISFENCTFTGSIGAANFALALACRQEISKKTGTFTELEMISLIGKPNEASMVFCSQLRQAKGLEDVIIQVASA
ncbi:hypothetical protein M408DRAFT_332909 [Serendipita vermifera MAFF 305830]|uniref:Uncharacterized protein n=1 Tax=Serendipita vermifera MAFF 305830 TaxID=933852 RepID=A0A0C3AT43_SERVB|nr:hypothetical protein M408DRAFT_332909 [Serendipita vermifera MAFF 305830]